MGKRRNGPLFDNGQPRGIGLELCDLNYVAIGHNFLFLFYCARSWGSIKKKKKYWEHLKDLIRLLIFKIFLLNIELNIATIFFY